MESETGSAITPPDSPSKQQVYLLRYADGYYVGVLAWDGFLGVMQWLLAFAQSASRHRSRRRVQGRATACDRRLPP